MFKHLFKLIWNKKKQNFLLMSEILVSFLVIFAVFTLVVYYFHNYKKPMGIDYQDVWVVTYGNSYQTKNTDSLDLYYETLVKTIRSMPQVKGLTFTAGNLPFTQNRNTGGITFKNQRVDDNNWYTVDDNYQKVLNMQLLEGRWFDKGDDIAKDKPVVINTDLKEKLFGNAEPLGKIISDRDNKIKMKIVGVVQSIKIKGDYSSTDPGLYQRTDTGSYRWLDRMLIKVTPEADAAFEGKLYKTIANYMKNSDIEIEHMTDMRTSINYFSLVPMIALLIVACFLIINVALGLFGVLWYNINKRRGEIGLRRAVGATGNSVSGQLVNEAMILATLSLIIGAFFAVQFPLLNLFDLPASVYIIALFLSIIFIYLLVLVCSLYPGKQAAAIYPAVALHEE
ncbi:MAG TPA: ABC transporter permease [Mucilaginibacter sp.]|jgi:putative ABC transport system permease protein|nr:ABC transporter permease [Mucilaginibacter sp.]